MNDDTRVTARVPCRIMIWLGVAGLCALISACSFDDVPFIENDKAASFVYYPPPIQNSVEQGRPVDDFLPPDQKIAEQKLKQKPRLGLSEQETVSLGCRLRDRFDRKAAFAYNFSGDQDRIALHLSVDGPSFSDPGRIEVNHMMLRFTHKLQKPAKNEDRKSKCLYPSQFQGLAGSIYNEFFKRDNYTIWEELDDRGVSFK